jgi:DNA-directed RNA polymerase specialized sigma24 family protein
MCSASLRLCVAMPSRSLVTMLKDLVHDPLVRAYEKRATFHTGGNLKVWLLSILHNVYVDRSQARYAEARHLAHVGELTEPHLPPRQNHHVCLCQVRQAFLALPKEQRAALHLVAIEGPMLRRLRRSALRSGL